MPKNRTMTAEQIAEETSLRFVQDTPALLKARILERAGCDGQGQPLYQYTSEWMESVVYDCRSFLYCSRPGDGQERYVFTSETVRSLQAAYDKVVALEAGQ